MTMIFLNLQVTIDGHKWLIDYLLMLRIRMFTVINYNGLCSIVKMFATYIFETLLPMGKEFVIAYSLEKLKKMYSSSTGMYKKFGELLSKTFFLSTRVTATLYGVNVRYICKVPFEGIINISERSLSMDQNVP